MHVIAHSIGCFVTLLLSPTEVEKIVLTGIPNADTSYVIKTLQKRIRGNGGTVDENGITTYPRSRGGTQYIGKDFWRTIKHLEPAKLLGELAACVKIAIFKPLQDDVLGPEHFEEYKNIKGVNYSEVAGDHNFTNLSDRQNLIGKIKDFLP